MVAEWICPDVDAIRFKATLGNGDYPTMATRRSAGKFMPFAPQTEARRVF